MIKFFLETHNFRVMLDQVRKEPFVTFVGVPGSGKTATVRHIALILQKEGYEIFPIKEINKIEDYCDQHTPQVFVIDDVFGVFGLNENELYMISKYSDRLKDPINPKTKTLMTCREAIFRHKMLSHCIFAKKDNVVYLQNQENALNSDDKQNLLEKYKLNKDLLSPSDLALSSSMFPLLCKLFSNEKEMDVYGPTFFISPVPCIIEQMNLLETRNKYHYVSLVLLMANENKLSEKIFDNENNETKETFKDTLFAEMKCNILRKCEVPSTTDSFQLLNALSEMEGTYTKKSDTEFVFIHDSMFEIVAYHFGRQFPELIFQFASSNYIANYIKVDNDNSQKRKRGHENEKIIDLCIQLHESKYQLLAERLFKDVQNGEFYNVFGNEALKNPSVLQNFIAVMEKTNYDYLPSLLLSEKIWKYELEQIDVKNEKHMSLTQNAHRCLVNKKIIDGEFRNTVRGIAWVILFGHNAILQSFFNQMMHRKENKADLFYNCFEKRPQPYSNVKESVTGTERDISTYNKLFSEKNIDIDDKVHVIYRRQTETTNTTYNTQVIVEQCRLLCLACYSCDLNTVQTLLKHVNTDALNNKVWPSTASHSKSPLIIACTYGCLDIVMELIEAGADVNTCFFFETPLTAACKNEQHSIVRVLLQSGASVNHEECIYTPLQCACQVGHALLVNELIKAGADVNLSRYGKSPLFAACNKGHYSVVKELILAGVDVNEQNNTKTALIIACDGGFFKLLKLLMKSGIKFDLNDKEKTTLNFPCYWYYLNIVNKLIEMESSFDLINTNEMSLTAECYRGHLEVVKEMIKCGATVNMRDGDKTPLIVACYKEHSHVVKELIEAGADVNLQNEFISPLQVACYEGHLSIVKELTKTEFDGNQISSVGKALVGACFFGHFSVVKELIACHVEVNLKYGKETPLTTTCYMGHLNIFKELIKAGADVNLNSGIITPLTSACYRGHIDIVSELIKEGADVNQNDGNRTPLSAACEEGYLMVVENLINAGADVNQSDGNKTPLTAACKIGHLYLVGYLIEAGADVNQGDGNKTPLTAANERGHWEVVRELLDAGADVNQSDGNKTPLMGADERGHWEVDRELLDVSADVHQSDGNNSPPTVERGELEYFQELMFMGSEFDGFLLPGLNTTNS